VEYIRVILRKKIQLVGFSRLVFVLAFFYFLETSLKQQNKKPSKKIKNKRFEKKKKQPNILKK
jgi:hypothetical protein